ncbi:MAG: hypothetical protein H7Z14_13645 [Anaerolineae bacterium]|nr:hypothetical protein [Phycisphaerae bacterium]
MSRIRASQLLAACAATVLPSIALAAITYVPSSSSVTLTHDANTSSGGADKTVNIAPPTSSSMTSFQINNTISGATSSLAKGSIGSVTNPTTATFTLAGGTGVTQVDPSHVWGPSSLKFNLNGVWNTGTTAFGPTATGYFSMGYAGTVGGAGSTAQVIINLTFKDNLGNNLRSAISFSDTITAAGSFAKTYTSSVPMTGGSVGANKQVKVNGTIEFRANNGGGPVDLSPVNFDCGGAPPTATWVANTGNFDDPANWNGTGADFIVEPGSTFPTVPNNPGDRARIVNMGLTGGVSRVLTVNNATTLGTLDIDDDDAVFLQPAGGGALNFSSASGDAVIHTGNSHGSASTSIETPVGLGSAMTVDVDSDSEFAARPGFFARPPGSPNNHAGLLNMTGAISGGQSITSIGDGTLELSGTAPNTFTGGLHSRAGIVGAHKGGALGMGTATIQDSRLDYGVSGAANPSTVTEMSALGQVSYTAGNIALSDRFSIADLSAVDAGPDILAQMRTQFAAGSVNLTLSPGAMIAHQAFDTGSVGNPQGIQPNSPLYVYGVSRFFGNQSIIVGSESNSPWRGFGAPRTNVSFGDGGQGQIGIAGDAELVSLRGTLFIDSQLIAVTPLPTITIRGGGHVIINSPPVPFAGPITVESGMLSILSDWTPQSITVLAGGAMGGAESNAPLIIQDNGHIAPGGEAIATFQSFSSLSLANLTQWDFDLDTAGVVGGPNDLLVVDGPVVLDGVLNVNGLENFGPGTYTIALLNGAITDNTVEIGFVPPNYEYDLSLVSNFQGVGSSLLLTVSDVPEPASIGCLAAAGILLGRRVRRVR